MTTGVCEEAEGRSENGPGTSRRNSTTDAGTLQLQVSDPHFSGVIQNLRFVR